MKQDGNTSHKLNTNSENYLSNGDSKTPRRTPTKLSSLRCGCQFFVAYTQTPAISRKSLVKERSLAGRSRSRSRNRSNWVPARIIYQRFISDGDGVAVGSVAPAAILVTSFIHKYPKIWGHVGFQEKKNKHIHYMLLRNELQLNLKLNYLILLCFLTSSNNIKCKENTIQQGNPHINTIFNYIVINID